MAQVLDSPDITEWPGPYDASLVLGVSPVRVRQMLDEGKLSYRRTRIGRLIDPVDLERLRAEREHRKQAATTTA